MKIAYAILASGLSRRMGEKRNKLLMTVNGKLLYQHICDAISDFSPKILVTSYPSIGAYAQSHDYSVVVNDKSNLGQSQSIKLAVQKILRINSQSPSKDKIQGILFAVADQPFITKEVIHSLTKVFQDHKGEKIIVPRFQDTPLNPCIFPMKFTQELSKLEGDTGGRKVYNKHLDDVIFVEFPDFKLFMDVDTPQALQDVEQYEQ